MPPRSYSISSGERDVTVTLTSLHCQTSCHGRNGGGSGGGIAVIGPRDGAQREYECKCQRECDQYLHGPCVSDADGGSRSCLQLSGWSRLHCIIVHFIEQWNLSGTGNELRQRRSGSPYGLSSPMALATTTSCRIHVV